MITILVAVLVLLVLGTCFRNWEESEDITLWEDEKK